MTEIPKYIRYDFLITLLGIICTGSAWFYEVVIGISRTSLAIPWIFGIAFILWGFTEMYNNYADEQDLKQLNLILEKKKSFDKIIKQKIISNNVKKDFTEYLKEEFDRIFQKSKDRKSN